MRTRRGKMRDLISSSQRGIDIMASNKAHRATGWAAGIIAAALVSKTGGAGPHQLCSVLALAAGVLGSTAPDWLEVAWWSRARRLWITHRTLTHWGVGWIALCVISYRLLGVYPFAAVTFGFACGGLMHLFADWPNPLGVPWIAARHSLNLWTSGRCDLLVVGAAWTGAGLTADHIWLHGALLHGTESLRLFHAIRL